MTSNACDRKRLTLTFLLKLIELIFPYPSVVDGRLHEQKPPGNKDVIFIPHIQLLNTELFVIFCITTV